MELAEALERWRSATELAWEAERSLEAAVVDLIDGRGAICGDLLESARQRRAQANDAFNLLIRVSGPSVARVSRPK